MDIQSKPRAKFGLEELNCSAFQRQKKLELIIYPVSVGGLRKERKRMARNSREMDSGEKIPWVAHPLRV